MYRSSLTLAFVVLYSAAGAASDLSSVYVAPGGIYAPSADVYVRPGPTYRQPPYAGPGYGYRQPSYGTPGYLYPAPASAYGEYGPAYAAQAYVTSARPPITSVTTLRIATTRRNATMWWNLRRGHLCPCPNGRDATTAMAGGPTTIKPSPCAGLLLRSA